MSADLLWSPGTFGQTISKGRSLIFVQSDFACQRVSHIALELGIALFSTAASGAMRALLAYDSYLKSGAVLMAVVPALTSGVRVRADRVIWIQGARYEMGGDDYQQAMWRTGISETPRHIIDEVSL